MSVLPSSPTSKAELKQPLLNESEPVAAVVAQSALGNQPAAPQEPLSPGKVTLLGAPTASTKAATTYYYLVQLGKVIVLASVVFGILGGLGMGHLVPVFSGLGLGNIGLIVPGALLFLPLLCVIVRAEIVKKKGEKVREELRDDLANATLKALKKTKENGPVFSKERFDNLMVDYPKFKRDLAILRDIVNNPVPNKGARFSKISEFHEAFNNIALSLEYQALANGNELVDELVDLMQQLAVTLCEEVQGLDAYRNFGQTCLGDLQTKHAEFFNQHEVASQSMGTLADILEKGLEHPPFAVHRRDTGGQKALWVSAHGDGFRASARSETQGIDFRDSIRMGNMLSVGWSYDNEAGKKIFTLFGPGTPEPVIEHWMRAKLKAGEKILYQNVQHYDRKGEDERINRFLKWAEQYPNFHMVSTPMDGDYWKMKGDKLQFENPKQFLYGSEEFDPDKENVNAADDSSCKPKGYRAFAETDRTFFTSRDKAIDTSKKQIAFKFAEKAFNIAYSNGQNEFWKNQVLQANKGKKRLGKMMQLGIDGFVAIGEIQRELKVAKDDTTMQKSPCKQQIDRGAVMAALTAILFDYSHGNKLTEQRIKEIEGALVGRAILVEGRMPQDDRYEPLLDLLRFFSGHEGELIETLKNFLGDYTKDIQAPSAV